jgi:hypothetical protein
VHAAANAVEASGWDWVAAAIGEAVEAGSAFVAPRRVARILDRWLAEGRGDVDGRPRRGGGRRGRKADVTEAARREASRVASACEDEAELALPPASPTEPAEAESRLEAGPSAAADQVPVRLAGLPAAPAATLRMALAAAGLEGDAYLRGAALAGWSADGRLLVMTLAPVPAVAATRLLPRLNCGLAGLLGRPVTCTLATARELAAARPPQAAGGLGMDYSRREASAAASSGSRAT